MSDAAWTELSLFESHDLVIKKYREKHDRDLNAAKAGEIVAHFAQARQYFDGADGAGVLVRPLLIYYGAVALARGLVLFMSSHHREATLKPSHGLSALGWSEALAKSTSAIGDLKVQLEQRGTFAEIAATTKNREYGTINVSPLPSTMLHQSSGSVSFQPGASVSLRDLLARVPQLADLYEQTYDELPAAYRAHVLAFDSSERVDVFVMGSIHRMPPPDVLRSRFSLPSNVTLEVRGQHRWVPEPHVGFSLKYTTRGELKQQLPPVWDVHTDSCWLVAPYGNGIRLSSFSTYFALAFVFGMLVRYHPTQWHLILGRRRGDLIAPLMREAIRVVENELPDRVATELIFGEGAAG